MSSPKLSPAPEVLTRIGVDSKDFVKAAQKYERIIAEPNRQDRESIEFAWRGLVQEHQQRFDERATSLLTTINGYRRGETSRHLHSADDVAMTNATSGSTSEVKRITVKEFAEAMSEMCFLGESTYFKTFRWISCSVFGADIAKAVALCLSSPSRVLRLLGIQATRMFASDSNFARVLRELQGLQWLSLSLDRENAQEEELMLGFILRLVELRLKEKCNVDDLFTHGIAMRIASALDVQDQLNTLTPQTRQRYVFVALQALEAFPLQCVGADLVRVLLTLCTVRGTTGDEMASILRTILGMYDDPHRRSFIRESDISALIVPFLESRPAAEADEHIGRMNQAANALSRLIVIWPGLLWLASESMCLRSLVDVLHLPGPIDRKMILLHLFNTVIRSIAPHRGIAPSNPWTGNSGRRRASTQAPTDYDLVDVDEVCATVGQGFEMYLERECEDGEEDDMIPTTKSIGYYTGDPMCATLLLVLEHHGLPQALITITKRSGNLGYELAMAHEAAMLLQHMLVLMDHLLPPSTVILLHSAFTAAIASLHGEKNLLVGTLTTTLFQNLNLSSTTASGGTMSTITQNAAGRDNRTPLSAPLLMEDQIFQNTIKESHVEQHNEPSKWNFEALLLLVQGPLRNPLRIRWARDNTRFFTRVLGFYKPSNMKSFATLRREECTDEVCGFGVALVEALLSCREGADILEKAEIPKAFRAMLFEISDDKVPTILTWERIGPGAPRIGQTFLMMLGRFTQSANGLNLLKRAGVTDILQVLFSKLTRPPSGSDLIYEVGHQLVQHLHLGSVPNYGVCEDIRGAVRLAMENRHSNPLRLCALMQLRKVLWRDLSTSMQWGIARLADALGDPFFTVVEHSFRMLASICCSSVQALDYLISLKPMALVNNQTLKDNRKRWGSTALLYRVVGRAEGCAFLNDAGWITEELQSWLATDSQAYLEDIERLSQGRDTGIVRSGPLKSSSGTITGSSFDSDSASRRTNSGSVSRSRGVSFTVSSSSQCYCPLHLIAELCRTTQGCALVEKHEVFTDAINALLQAGVEEEEPVSPKTTSALQTDTTNAWMNATLTDGAFVNASNEDAAVTQTPQAMRGGDVDDSMADDVDELNHMNHRSMNSQKVSSSIELDHDAELISAARGYLRPQDSHERAVDAHGDLIRLKRSILTLCNVCSSNNGFEMLASQTPVRGEHIQRILDIAHHSNFLSLRGVAMFGVSIVSRSPSGAQFLAERKYSVVQLSSAYVSASGLPYSVAFAHPASPSWMYVKRPLVHRGHAPRNAYREGHADSKFIPKEISDGVAALSNPINRDAAKSKLHTLFKDNHRVFLDPNVQRLLVDTSSMYRLRSAERKFVSELLQRSMANQRKLNDDSDA